MKNDREVRLMRRERAKSRNQEVAAARTGMSVRTLRKYERAGKLPSQVKQPHTWQTRADPFIHDWPWVVGELERDPALQGKTLFEVLQEQHPGRYVPGQLRTLQRHIAAWRCMHGPEREVMFEQVHSPGEAIQSDFTHAADLAVMLDGTPFPHLLFHSVLTYSNVEAVSVCFSESFEALAEGLEAALPAFGGVPATHRTDNLSAAIRELGRDGRRDFTVAYRALLEHYGMIGSTNHPGVSHQNGDVESAHHQFKRALDQALRVRGHRDFRDRGAYEQFLTELVRRRNATRSERFAVEREHLRPLPPSPLLPCKELLVKVNRFSLIRVQDNVYSVPSRLIGARLRARLRAETIELYQGASLVLRLPRIIGRNRQRIDYRHLIGSLLRKPGAFMAYKYREEMFPTLVFRQAFDALQAQLPARAVREYLHLLHLAAHTSEAEVAAALEQLLAAGTLPTFEACRALLPRPVQALDAGLSAPVIDLTVYDRLMGGSAHG
ncbi:MAG: IS21 family transposase [Sulfuricaulis sp.]|uniref:IS21 family transposase n=1 Tax=Sulfuricaulis sp. TaxID=2003553 RepID=UPI003C5B7DFB